MPQPTVETLQLELEAIGYALQAAMYAGLLLDDVIEGCHPKSHEVRALAAALDRLEANPEWRELLALTGRTGRNWGNARIGESKPGNIALMLETWEWPRNPENGSASQVTPTTP